METAPTKIARLERSIARTGETVTLERLSTDPTTGASVVLMSLTLPAHVRASQPQDLLDNEARDIAVILSPTLLLAASIGSPPVAYGLPQRDDRVTVQGAPANVQTVMPLYYTGQLVRVNLLCRG